MRTIAEILIHTPPWVWLVLAYLVWAGVQAMSERSQPLWRMLIVPTVFFVMGLRRLFVSNHAFLPPLAWAVGFVALGLLAWTHGPRVTAVDRVTGLVTRPGSATPLLRNILVFILQYAVAVTSAMHLDPAGFGVLASYAVSGATSGYFAGWAAALILHYRQAAAASPATS